MSQGPLGGLRVLDLGTRIGAPFAATLLGDLGADVIKIELPKQGDFMRTIGPFVDGYSLDRPEEGVAVDEGPDRPHEVALLRQLDLDDVGAQVAQERGRERRADAGAQVEDAKPAERPLAHRLLRGAGANGLSRSA